MNEGRLPIASVVARFASGLAEGGSRPHLEWRRLLPATLEHEVFGPAMSGLAGTTPYRDYAAFYDAAPGGVLDRAMLADQQFHLQSVLAKVDAMSMAHSLEVRVPLLNRRIIGPRRSRQRETAQSLEWSSQGHCCAPSRGASARQWASSMARKKGFNVPIARMLRRELAPIGDHLLTRDADLLAPYLNPDTVRALWRAAPRWRRPTTHLRSGRCLFSPSGARVSVHPIEPRAVGAARAVA